MFVFARAYRFREDDISETAKFINFVANQMQEKQDRSDVKGVSLVVGDGVPGDLSSPESVAKSQVFLDIKRENKVVFLMLYESSELQPDELDVVGRVRAEDKLIVLFNNKSSYAFSPKYTEDATK